MSKFIAAVCLFTVMGVAISLIDARSTNTSEPLRSTEVRQAATGTIYATGMVEGVTENVQLRVECAGRVREIFVGPGKWVEAGDVLLRLDGDRQRQEVALASAKFELARAELERIQNGARLEEREEARALQRASKARLGQAEQTWQRIKQLTNERAVSQQEADNQLAQVNALRAELEAAEARVRQIEAPARPDELRAAEARVAATVAELELAKIGLFKTELRAPRRACVLDVNTLPGELTGPDVAQPLVVLSDTSTIRVRAFVEELDAPRVAVGMPAEVTADGIPDKAMSGRVVTVSPRMETKSIHTDRPYELYDTKVREVYVEITDETELIVGLRVDVQFEVTIPIAATKLESSSP